MTVAGWIEIAALPRAAHRAHARVGGYMARVFRGERRPVRRAPVERRSTGCSASTPTRGQDWKALRPLGARLQRRSFGRALRDPADAGPHPFNPVASRRAVGPHVQHDVVVRHEHELAVLRGRDDALVLLADGRAGGAELRLRRRRHRGRSSPSIRGFAARSGARARHLLRRPHRADPLRAAAALDRRRARPRLPGRHPDALGPRRHDVAGGSQTLALGPVASQEAIKQLGTNGGGFFNVNSAMPFENPTWLTNFVEMLAILLIPAGLTATYGRMVGNRRQGWAIFAAMLALFVAGGGGRLRSRVPARRAAMHAAGLDRRQHRGQGAALRHRARPRCSPPSPPPPPAAPSTPPWSRSAASAARSRWRR